LIAVLLTVLIGVGCKRRVVEVAEVDYESLQWKDGVYQVEGAPFTGVAWARHGDGSPKGQYPLEDGVFHGVVREWWENGNQAVETHFEKGQRHGLNQYWDLQGRLTKRQIYERDQSVSEEIFKHEPDAAAAKP
jgi:hypothetical protein